MSDDLDDARRKAKATYDAASDHYDDAANAFWSRFGRRTVERLALQPGEHVLDVCCGTGASALPAAERVGPRGRVLGIDLSEKLLTRARAKAHERGLAHVEFRRGDLLEPPRDAGPFDAVVCVFGIFFVPDMRAAVSALWSAVRPGGRLAITTWGPRFLEPGSSAFWSSIAAVRPDLERRFAPWDRISEPEALRKLLRESGCERIEAVAEAGAHPLASPEAWWSAVMGTGYRATIEQLDERERESVRAACLDWVRRSGARAVEANVVFATARKP